VARNGWLYVSLALFFVVECCLCIVDCCHLAVLHSCLICRHCLFRYLLSISFVIRSHLDCYLILLIHCYVCFVPLHFAVYSIHSLLSFAIIVDSFYSILSSWVLFGGVADRTFTNVLFVHFICHSFSLYSLFHYFVVVHFIISLLACSQLKAFIKTNAGGRCAKSGIGFDLGLADDRQALISWLAIIWKHLHLTGVTGVCWRHRGRRRHAATRVGDSAGGIDVGGRIELGLMALSALSSFLL